ncbi:putative hydroxyquinol 1,2-dioxygenase [Coniochaeta sp. 2T2.1]|nr:putative hydroxyquinol 1,2-dioxygenase [Coniochaeta sp. 2T2.1]
MGSLNGHHKYDPTFTERVIAATGPKASPRTREIIGPLLRHLHDFAREVDLTVDEWMAGVELVNWAGQMSNDKRNEGQLLCDVLGLESLVDEITFSAAASAKDAHTATAILGPFFRKDAPHYPNGASIIKTMPADGQVTYMHGRCVDSVTGKGIPGVVIDVWEDSTNGLYEQQDPDQADCNLRGRFTTDEEGRYSWYCLRPTPYPIPFDGPAGKVLQLLDRHPMRPAHIHLITTHSEYMPITTQIFDESGPYLTDDSVFAVKDSLLVKFQPRENDPKATLEVLYDFKLKKQPSSSS